MITSEKLIFRNMPNFELKRTRTIQIYYRNNINFCKINFHMDLFSQMPKSNFLHAFIFSDSQISVILCGLIFVVDKIYIWKNAFSYLSLNKQKKPPKKSRHKNSIHFSSVSTTNIMHVTLQSLWSCLRIIITTFIFQIEGNEDIWNSSDWCKLI